MTPRSVPEFPSTVHVELCNTCNLACDICYCRNMEREKGFMKPGLFEKIADEAARHAPVTIAPFLHGESLLHPQFLELMACAKSKDGITIALDTNGTLLTEKVADEMVKIGVDSVSISFHGNSKETFESVMVGSNFEEVSANVRYLARKARGGNTSVMLTFVLNSRNEPEKEDFVRTWLPYVTSIVAKKEISPESVFENWEIERDNIERPPCEVLWTSTLILWNGDVVLCCKDYEGDIPLGNVAEQSIGEIWISPRMQEIRAKHEKLDFTDPAMCANCETWFAYLPAESRTKDGVQICSNVVQEVYSSPAGGGRVKSLVRRLLGRSKP